MAMLENVQNKFYVVWYVYENIPEKRFLSCHSVPIVPEVKYRYQIIWSRCTVIEYVIGQLKDFSH